jgi:DNA-binding transcriptional MocR family regulator
MSFQAMAWAVKQILPSREKLVLLMAANYADEYGKCWPSNARLMADTGMTKNTITSAFKELAARGLLRIEHRSIEGVSLSNMYHLNVDNEQVNLRGGRSGDDRGVGQEMTGGGSGDDPKPIIEPISKTISSSSTQNGFEDFWRAYPRKTGKGAAEKAWAKAAGVVEPSKILEAVASAVWSPEPQFIPHPATWLNQKRWEDEAPAIRPARKERDLRNIPDHMLSNEQFMRKRMQLKEWR